MFAFTAAILWHIFWFVLIPLRLLIKFLKWLF